MSPAIRGITGGSNAGVATTPVGTSPTDVHTHATPPAVLSQSVLPDPVPESRPDAELSGDDDDIL